MTHSAVLVALPATTTDILDGVDVVLAPFDENRHVEWLFDDGEAYSHNPDGRWDYWGLPDSGRWAGWFVRHAGADHLVLPRTGPDGELRCGGGPRRCLDLARTRSVASDRATREWDEYSGIVAGTAEPTPWRRFARRVLEARAKADRAEGDVSDRFRRASREAAAELGIALDFEYCAVRDTPRDAVSQWSVRCRELEGASARRWAAAMTYPLERAHDDYGRQERVRAVRDSGLYGDHRHDDPVTRIGRWSRDGFAARAAEAAVPGAALVTSDGTWIAAEFGDHEMLHPVAPAVQDAYRDRVNAYVDGMDGDDRLVLVDCHS